MRVNKELYRRPLVIAVYEPRWFMKVLRILEDREIPYRLYYDPETVPPYSILYTDNEYFVNEMSSRSDVEIHYDPGDTCRGLEEAILAAQNKSRYRVVTIGIDPGPNPYYVVIGDGELLEHGYIMDKSIDEVILWATACYPAEKRIVRIGGGHNGLEIAAEIAGEIEDVVVEIVDEKETTPKNRGGLNNSEHTPPGIRPFRNKDAYAALRIAYRKGIRILG